MGTFYDILTRIIVRAVQTDAFNRAVRYAIRQSTAAIVRAIRTRREQRSSGRISFTIGG